MYDGPKRKLADFDTPKRNCLKDTPMELKDKISGKQVSDLDFLLRGILFKVLD